MIAINKNNEAVPFLYILTDCDLRQSSKKGKTVVDFKTSASSVNTIPTLIYINKDGKAALLKSRYDDVSIKFIDLNEVQNDTTRICRIFIKH